MADMIQKPDLAPGEKRAYVLKIAARNPDAATPSVSSVEAYNSAGTKITATALSGSSTPTTTQITLPVFTAPADDTSYQIKAIYAIGSNLFETNIFGKSRKRGYA